jgi:hypothetical protein
MTIPRIVVVTLCSLLAAVAVPAQEGKPGDKPAGKAQEPAKKPVFVIIEASGKHEVLTKETFDAKNKTAEADHKKAMETFEKDKKAAEAAHKKLEAKEPKLQLLTPIGGEFDSKEAADAAVKKLEEAKKKEKQKEKETPPKQETPPKN